MKTIAGYAAVLLATVAAASFNHPGVLIDADQLAWVKQQWRAGATPFAESFTKAEAFYLTSRANATGPPSNGTIACG